MDTKNIKNEQETKELAVLVGVTDTSKHNSATASMDIDEETTRSVEELELLAKTAGAVVVGTAIQRRHGVDSKTFVGKGKLTEIANACEELGATLLIFDDELLGSQIKSIEEITGLKVIDRTLLILDIFAQRAKSKEGKLQVELAQQKYRYSRLVGLGKSLSRLAGGIGTRGPGESKLESDRRHLMRRIDYLKAQIKEIGVRRERIRDKRRDKETITIAVVGYTNAGKSTLINRLCESDLFAEDMLFATLDPTARQLVLPDGYNVVLIDTVGFIRKLPHNLVEAFKSTLEELSDADIIMHVVDSSDPDLSRHMEIVEELMTQLNSAGKPRITVFNKTDLLASSAKTNTAQGKASFNGNEGTIVEMSSLTGQGSEMLLEEISCHVRKMKIKMEICIPYDKAQLLDYVRKNGTVEEVEYLNDCIKATVGLPASKVSPLDPYISKK